MTKELRELILQSTRTLKVLARLLDEGRKLLEEGRKERKEDAKDWPR